jgi:hypothetical protein
VLLLIDSSGGRPPDEEPRRRRGVSWRPFLPAVAPGVALAGAATEHGAVGAGFAFLSLALIVRALARWVDGFGLREFRQ